MLDILNFLYIVFHLEILLIRQNNDKSKREREREIERESGFGAKLSAIFLSLLAILVKMTLFCIIPSYLSKIFVPDQEKKILPLCGFTDKTLLPFGASVYLT
jgi:Predicted metal-dependent enzyme